MNNLINWLSAAQSWGIWINFAVEALAVVAFALSGILVAAQKRLDAVGVFVVAFLTAFGGGTLRDILLDQRPFFWVKHSEVLPAVLLLCALTMMFLRRKHFSLTQKAILWPDALGLGLFTASGVSQSLQAGMPWVVCLVMGVVTGVFGGVLRDLVCNEIPVTFRDHQPYALCAVAGGGSYLILLWFDWPIWTLSLVCVLVTSGLRALSVWQQWKLPAWQIE